MARYLIEFRFIDKRAKAYMKHLARQVFRRYRIGQSHYVPHISLVGGFTTSNEKKLVADVLRVCNSYPVMHFGIRGFSTFDENRVVFLEIDPSEQLKNFRWELSQTLKNYCQLKKPYDFNSKDEFVFHSTVAMAIPSHKFDAVKKFILRKKYPLKSNYVLARVTILKSSIILREYDFLQRRMLSRFEAKNPVYYRKTERLMAGYLDHTYDPNSSIAVKPRTEEKKRTAHPVPKRSPPEQSSQYESPGESSSGLFRRFFNFFKPKKMYLIADLHLDHANIIRYCNRPFRNVRQMNQELVRKWNTVVRNKDTVFFLGDLVYGKSNHGHKYWIKKLRGNKTLIRGNHDVGTGLPFRNDSWLSYKGKKFYLVHNPDTKETNWNGWTIHGHHHNNNPKKYPFINGALKTINVSADVIGYTPLDIDYLFDIDFEGIEFMKDIDSEPRRYPR